MKNQERERPWKEVHDPRHGFIISKFLTDAKSMERKVIMTSRRNVTWNNSPVMKKRVVMIMRMILILMVTLTKKEMRQRQMKTKTTQWLVIDAWWTRLLSPRVVWIFLSIVCQSFQGTESLTCWRLSLKATLRSLVAYLFTSRSEGLLKLNNNSKSLFSTKVKWKTAVQLRAKCCVVSL